MPLPKLTHRLASSSKPKNTKASSSKANNMPTATFIPGSSLRHEIPINTLNQISMTISKAKRSRRVNKGNIRGNLAEPLNMGNVVIPSEVKKKLRYELLKRLVESDSKPLKKKPNIVIIEKYFNARKKSGARKPTLAILTRAAMNGFTLKQKYELLKRFPILVRDMTPPDLKCLVNAYPNVVNYVINYVKTNRL